MLFANAKVAAQPKAAAKAKAEKRNVALEGLRDSAAIDFVITSLTTIKTTIDADLKAAIKIDYVTEGFRNGRRPETFVGVDGETTASCQLRSKSTSVRIPDADLAVLKKYGISVTDTPDLIETFIINPAYLGDGELLTKVSAAIEGVEGIPADFIQKQEATIKTTLSANSVDEVFALAAKRDEKGERTISIEELTQLVEIVSTNAITPNFGSKDVSVAYAVLKDLVPELSTTDAQVAASTKKQAEADAKASASLADALKASLLLEEKAQAKKSTASRKKAA